MTTNLWVSRWKSCPEKSDSCFLWEITQLWSLISVVREINVFNVNALLLVTSAVTKADLTWLPSGKP